MYKKIRTGFTEFRTNAKGSLLINVIILMTFLITVGLAVATVSSSQYEITSDSVFRANALLVSEAGVEQTLRTLNQDEAFTGFASPQVFFNNEKQGRATYETTIADVAGDSSAKEIISTGKVYRFGTDNIVSEQSVKVTTVGTSSEGFSVHTGPGGLILGGSANITNSNVYVNGFITLDGAAKIGTNDYPVDVQVAHNSCPTGNNPGPTYPTTCTTGQPITMAYSTTIYGTVCATNQTNLGPRPGGNILPGISGQGLLPGCVAPAVATPTYDRAQHISRMTTTGSGTSNTYVCANWPFLRTWPANLRLNGNVDVGGSCDVTITGDTYITGNFTLGGAAKIRVADSVGTKRPIVVVDGNINVGGSGGLIANSQGTGIQFISYKSTAACNPNCTTVTGNDLKQSQNLTTVDIGGGVNLPGMIFQAYWGKIRIGGSGNIGAALGQTVDMQGAGTVTFGTQIASGERTWTITSYQRLYQ